MPSMRLNVRHEDVLTVLHLHGPRVNTGNICLCWVSVCWWCINGDDLTHGCQALLIHILRPYQVEPVTETIGPGIVPAKSVTSNTGVIDWTGSPASDIARIFPIQCIGIGLH